MQNIDRSRELKKIIYVTSFAVLKVLIPQEIILNMQIYLNLPHMSQRTVKNISVTKWTEVKMKRFLNSRKLTQTLNLIFL